MFSKYDNVAQTRSTHFCKPHKRRTIQSLQNSVLLANARAKAKNILTLSKTKTFKTGGITRSLADVPTQKKNCF